MDEGYRLAGRNRPFSARFHVRFFWSFVGRELAGLSCAVLNRAGLTRSGLAIAVRESAGVDLAAGAGDGLRRRRD
ncbi:MAG: hypothetical protein JWR77_18 [Rhizorhabdus sp.]|nr:hypothetical protein [Rhizorhabdus sp.]